jgi:hypothetical protein
MSVYLLIGRHSIESPYLVVFMVAISTNSSPITTIHVIVIGEKYSIGLCNAGDRTGCKVHVPLNSEAGKLWHILKFLQAKVAPFILG